MNISIFIYSSLEVLLRPSWISMIQKMIDTKLLRLVCIDEAHFVFFGLSFCPNFADLCDALFKHLVSCDEAHYIKNLVVPVGGCCLLKVPLLFMTATITNELVKYLQRLVGFQMYPQNYLLGW